jgi:hypothetical protein
MEICTHELCDHGFVQGPSDVDLIMFCMLRRGILVKVNEKYVLDPKRAMRNRTLRTYQRR